MALYTVRFERLDRSPLYDPQVVSADAEHLAPAATARLIVGPDGGWSPRRPGWRTGQLTRRSPAAAGGVIDPRTAVTDTIRVFVAPVACAWDDCAAHATTRDAAGDYVCAAHVHRTTSSAGLHAR